MPKKLRLVRPHGLKKQAKARKAAAKARKKDAANEKSKSANVKRLEDRISELERQLTKLADIQGGGMGYAGTEYHDVLTRMKNKNTQHANKN